LKIALDSSHECVTWNTKAHFRKHISHQVFEENRKLSTEMGKMISALRRGLKNK
jgi:hypothetical protein